MKKSLLLIFFITFVFTLSSCQSSTTADKDAASKEPSSSSISTQAKTDNKQETSEQTTTASKDKTSEQTEDSSEDELANTTDKNVNYKEIYNNFLLGQTDAIDKGKSRENIYYYLGTDSKEDIQKYKYAIYDMNGDDIPELIVRNRIGLDIFWIYNNELAHWHSNAQYAKPLNNMALLYERHGGAPTHTDYQYFVLGYQGEELYQITFGEYFCENTDGVIYDEKYYINNIEVTKAIYDSLSERFLNIGDDKIEWKPLPY